jgi:putative tryptophan/tyrosine transport system substrate-binding protein
MRRRGFITLLGGAAAWPLAAWAQPSGQMRRVALLFGLGEHDDLGRAYLTAFQKRFQELGWIEGRNARFDIRWAADNPALTRSHARELVSFNPDVMFCQSGPAFIALREQTSTIPIVFTQVT